MTGCGDCSCSSSNCSSGCGCSSNCSNCEQVCYSIKGDTSWNIPACGQSAVVVVPGLLNVLLGSYIWNPSYGYFKITAFNTVTGQLTVLNECLAGNAAGGTVVPICTDFAVMGAPNVAPGTGNLAGIFPYLAIDFTIPAVSDCVTITVTNVNGLYVGGSVEIGTGTYSISDIPSATSITICNDLGSGGTPGATVSARGADGFYVTPITGVLDCCATLVPAVAAVEGDVLTLQGQVTAIELNDQVGWFEVSETLTYVSASTVSIVTGGASRFSIGEKLRFKQGGGYKYVYIVAVADTLLTVSGGSDYSVANAAITDVASSHSISPVGFPEWFNWSPTIVGFSANPVGATYLFSISGRIVTVLVTTPTGGTSNATTYTLTVPVTELVSAESVGLISRLANNSVVLTEPGQVIVGSGLLNLYTDLSSAVWTNVGTKSASFQVLYRI